MYIYTYVHVHVLTIDVEMSWVGTESTGQSTSVYPMIPNVHPTNEHQTSCIVYPIVVFAKGYTTQYTGHYTADSEDSKWGGGGHKGHVPFSPPPLQTFYRSMPLLNL